jgi:hypothetical protein
LISSAQDINYWLAPVNCDKKATLLLSYSQLLERLIAIVWKMRIGTKLSNLTTADKGK